MQRKKVRDYYDIWRMEEQEVNKAQATRLFVEKLRKEGIKWNGLRDVFPADLEVILAGYWEKELGRLVWPVPEMNDVLAQLKADLSWLNAAKTH